MREPAAEESAARRSELEAARSVTEAIGDNPEREALLETARDAAVRLAERRERFHREAARAEALAGRRRRLEDDSAARARAEAEARELLRTVEARRQEQEEALRVAGRGDRGPLDALEARFAAARRDEAKARRDLEAARGAAAVARAEVAAARRHFEEADHRARELAVEIGREAGALQAEVGDLVRDEPGETVEERLLAAIERVGRQRADRARGVE